MFTGNHRSVPKFIGPQLYKTSLDMKNIFPATLKTFQTILITSVHDSPPSNSCFAQNYYGTYDNHRVFLPTLSCLEESVGLLFSGHLVQVESPQLAYLEKFDGAVMNENEYLSFVWVGRQEFQQSLFLNEQSDREDEFSVFLEKISSPGLIYTEDMSENFMTYTTESNDLQVKLSSPQDTPAAQILYRTPTTALLAIQDPYAKRLDLFLPPYYKPRVLPTSSITLPNAANFAINNSNITAYDITVPPSSIIPLQNLLESQKYDEKIANIINNISDKDMKNDIRWLTGEDEDSPIVGRLSFSRDIMLAAEWLKERMEETGAECELRRFMLAFGPNVICQYPISSAPTYNSTIIISAHYDSLGTFIKLAAPGANDDGSGTALLLSIGKVIKRKNIEFKNSFIQLVFFAGEEQGIYGSRSYARELREQNVNITLMIHSDMLAYHVPSERRQLALPQTIGTDEVAQLVRNAAKFYAPELEVGITGVCCSDHQSFHEQGYPATHIFERNGPIADPMYHNSRDLSDREGFDFEQIKLIAGTVFAVLLHAAGFDSDDE